VANRLLPEAIKDPWFKAWRETHAEHLAAIEDGFSPLPVLKADLAPEELIGVPRLRQFGQVLYGDLDAAAVLHATDTLRLERRGDTHVLCLPLPFCENDELEVARRDGDLLVRVGPYRRAVALPGSLLRRRVTGATLKGGWLEVGFTSDGAVGG
jgi:arsenite-transporting ATPase